MNDITIAKTVRNIAGKTAEERATSLRRLAASAPDAPQTTQAIRRNLEMSGLSDYEKSLSAQSAETLADFTQPVARKIDYNA